MLKRFAVLVVIAAALPAIGYPTEHSGRVLRTLGDSSASQRWELRWDSVHLYDAATLQPIGRYALDGAAQSASRDFCPPDIAAGAGGVAYVTSNAQPVIWRISAAGGQVERLDLDTDSDHAKDSGFTGLALSADGRTLYGVGSADGAPWRLDPEARKAYKLGPAAGVDRNCGR